jgi:hypothetical protein
MIDKLAAEIPGERDGGRKKRNAWVVACTVYDNNSPFGYWKRCFEGDRIVYSRSTTPRASKDQRKRKIKESKKY